MPLLELPLFVLESLPAFSTLGVLPAALFVAPLLAVLAVLAVPLLLPVLGALPEPFELADFPASAVL